MKLIDHEHGSYYRFDIKYNDGDQFTAFLDNIWEKGEKEVYSWVASCLLYATAERKEPNK